MLSSVSTFVSKETPPTALMPIDPPQLDDAKESEDTQKVKRDLPTVIRLIGHLFSPGEIEKSILWEGQLNGNSTPLPGLAARITLKIFRQESKMKIDQIVQLFDLTRGIQVASRKGSFLSMVTSVHPAVLDQVTLYDLQLAGALGRFRAGAYLFCHDETIYKMTLNTFEQLTSTQRNIVQKRLELINHIDATENDSESLTIGSLRQAKGAHLKKIFPNPGETALRLLTDAQIGEALTLSLFEAEELEWLMKNRPNAIRSDEAIQQIVEKISDPALYDLPLIWIGRIDMKKLTDRRIEDLFYYSSKREARLERLSTEMLNYVVQKIDSYSLNSLSLQDRAKIHISLLDQERIWALFSTYDPQAMEIFRSFPPLEINEALPRLKKEYMEQLSKAQLRGLDTTKCTQEQVDALFPNPNPFTEYQKVGQCVFNKEIHYEFRHKSSKHTCSYTLEEIRERIKTGWNNLKRLKVLSQKQIEGFGDKLRPEHKKILTELNSKKERIYQ